MQFHRRFPPLREWRLPTFGLERRSATRWAMLVLGLVLLGYLTAFFFVFPTPILHARQTVPRVLGLTLQDASREIRDAGLQVVDGGTEPHPTAPQGTIIWQDPPPGVSAVADGRVTLVSSAGPPKIPVPDVTGLDGSVARRLITAAGLSVAQVESIQVPRVPPGVVGLTRPPAGEPLAPGAGVALVISRGEATITVPDLTLEQKPPRRTPVRWLRENSIRIAVLAGVIEAVLAWQAGFRWLWLVGVAAVVGYLYVRRRVPLAMRRPLWMVAMSTQVSPSSLTPGYVAGPPNRAVNCNRRQLLRRATESWPLVPTTAK